MPLTASSLAATAFHLIVRSPQTWPPGPALQKILARGQTERVPSSSGEVLCMLMGLTRQQDWPIAALSAPVPLAEKCSGYWLRLDPVHLEVGMRGMFVRSGMTLDAEEAQQLRALLTPLCAPLGLKLLHSPEGVTHIHLEHPPELHTTALDEAENRQAAHTLPKGKDAALWSRLLNEIQMSLHAHPLNQMRETRGVPPLNSLWLWGGGVLPAGFVPPPLRLHANAAWMHACVPAPAGQAARHAARVPRLAMLDIRHGEGLSLDELEQHWFAPLLQALQRGRLDTLHVHLLNEQQPASISLRRAQAWRFWR